jgi:hypothetical protein
MHRPGRNAAFFLVAAAPAPIAAAQDQGLPESTIPAGADAAAQAALPMAEIRRISGEVRRIEGPGAVIVGAVRALESVSRGIEACGSQHGRSKAVSR